MRARAVARGEIPERDSEDTGLVFDIDPVTTNGGPLPSANSAALNPVRVAETLLGLTAPTAGTQTLTGDTVLFDLYRTDTDFVYSAGKP